MHKSKLLSQIHLSYSHLFFIYL